MQHNIGLDVAFSRYKIATAETVRQIPSLVSRTEQVTMYGVRQEKPLRVEFNSTEAWVGAGDAMRADFGMLTGAWEQRALTYAAFYRLLGSGEHTVRIVAGLPVQVLMSGNARQTVKALRDWLEGEHVYLVRTKVEMRVQVERVLVRPQPSGAFYEWSLNESGLWARSEDVGLRYAVVDVGSNTLDCTVLQDAAPVPALSGGAQLGMSWAAGELAKRSPTRLTLPEADELLIKYLESGRAITTANDDVSGLVSAVLDDWRSKAEAYISRLWPGSDHTGAVTLVTGGGAAVVRDVLRDYRNVEVLKDPVTANARGLAKYARRDGIWKS